MARLPLNKATLSDLTAKLQVYERHLPSLDLKRRQRLEEQSRARARLEETRAEIAALRDSVSRDLPMLHARFRELVGIVRLRRVDLGAENLVGVELPMLRDVELERQPYALLLLPPWVDLCLDRVEEMVRLRVREEVEAQRVGILDAAVKKVTQRVNLFEKVLIPRSRETIRRVRIHLSDAERAAIVSGKIAKRRRVVGVPA